MSWNVKDFKRNIDTLWSWYRESSDYQEKDVLLRQIQTIMDQICELEFDRHSDLLHADSLNLDQILESESESQKVLTQHMISSVDHTLVFPHLSEFRSKLESFRGISSFSFVEDYEPRLSIEDLKELTHEFFKQTTREIYRYYKQFSNDDIVFNTDRDAGNGYTYFNPGVNMLYVDVGLAGDRRRTLSALTHERGHVIGVLLNNDRMDNKDFFYEIEGLFFQLIGEDYFAKELNDNAFDRFRLEKLLTYYQDTSKVLRCRKAALETFEEMSKGENPYTLFNYYSNGEDFTKLDMDDVVKNVFSYIVAIELRDIYLQDKDLAFELLKDIVLPDEERTEYQRITDSVTPCMSLVKAKKKIYKSIRPSITGINMNEKDKE